MSITATINGACSIECASDIDGTMKVAGGEGSAAAIMQASAQFIPNDFAGQQGHFGACPWWLAEVWQ